MCERERKGTEPIPCGRPSSCYVCSYCCGNKQLMLLRSAYREHRHTHTHVHRVARVLVTIQTVATCEMFLHLLLGTNFSPHIYIFVYLFATDACSWRVGMFRLLVRHESVILVSAHESKRTLVQAALTQPHRFGVSNYNVIFIRLRITTTKRQCQTIE